MATGLQPGYRYAGQAKHKLSYNQWKRLAEAFGMPGDAIAQIVKGESGGYADVQQRDPGDGMVGYGGLQMTPNAWGKNSAAYKHLQSLGGIAAMKDPVKNMDMARFLYKAAGNRLTPWYGTRFLTNRSGEGTLGPIDRSKLAGLGGGGSGRGASASIDGSPAKIVPGTPPSVQLGTSTTDTSGALVDTLLARSSGKRRVGGGLLKALDARLASGAYTTTTPTKIVDGTPTRVEGGTGDVTTGGGGGGDLASRAHARADVIDAKQMPYKWGGGHGARIIHAKDATPLDCSGAVSAVLGINPRVSGQFENWGSPGDGGNRGVTVYANGHHVLMKINGRFFGTSGSNPGGGAGWIDSKHISPGYLAGFKVRHSG